MIQRIQSLYLLLVTASLVCLFFLPFASVTLVADAASFKILHLMDIAVYQNSVEKIKTAIYLPVILNTILLAISIVAIFIYKNRKIQMMLCKVMLLLLSVFTALMFYNAETLNANDGSTTKIIYHAGTYMPVICLVLAYMAYHAIKKDDELVKSADRLR